MSVALVAGLVQLAPALAKLFGKGEKAAELAADVARTITGETDDASVLRKLSGNPELLVQYQTALLNREVELEKLTQQDRDSARTRDAEFLKAGTRNYRGDFLVGVSFIVVCTILAIVIMVPELSEYAKGTLTTILGVFLAKMTDIFAFEFGTTRKKEEDSAKVLTDYIKS